MCYPFTIVFFIYLYLLCNFFCISFIWQQNKPTYIYWLGCNLYLLPHLNTYNYMQSFQYKFLNNVNFLNKNLPTFEWKSFSLCSLCNLYERTPFRIFYGRHRIECSWSDFQNSITLPTLTPQTDIFSILESASKWIKF